MIILEKSNETSKIYQEERHLPGYYVIRHTKLLAIQSMININLDQCQTYEKPRDTTTHAGTEIITEDQQLANALHKPITTKIRRWKVYPSYQDNIWDADLADLQVISKYSGLSILQWVININKYA